MREWSRANREVARQRARDQYKKIKASPERLAKRKETRRKYRIKTKSIERERHRLYMLRYRRENIHARIAHNVRTRLCEALKRKFTKKVSGTEELIGCNVFVLRAYIERMFRNGMNWSNYGRSGWHIDHIKPLDQFNLADMEQQKVAFHYTNLQPLWGIDNLVKGNGRRNIKVQ